VATKVAAHTNAQPLRALAAAVADRRIHLVTCQTTIYRFNFGRENF
jgi:hypothetical protein